MRLYRGFAALLTVVGGSLFLLGMLGVGKQGIDPRDMDPDPAGPSFLTGVGLVLLLLGLLSFLIVRAFSRLE